MNRRYVGGKVNTMATSKLEGNDFVMILLASGVQG